VILFFICEEFSLFFDDPFLCTKYFRLENLPEGYFEKIGGYLKLVKTLGERDLG